MKVSQSELFGVVAILLYIAFFSHSPPQIIASALGNVYVSVALLAGLTYLTLYESRSIGALLIIALLLTMTGGIEHLSNASNLVFVSVAPKSHPVRGKCPNPGTAMGTDRSCHGPCRAGTILSGSSCMRVSGPAAPTVAPAVAPAVAPTVPVPAGTPSNTAYYAGTPKILNPNGSCSDGYEKSGVLCYPPCKAGFHNVMGICQPNTVASTTVPGSVTPNISTPVGSPVTNTPIPLPTPTPAVPKTPLQTAAATVTSDPKAAAHIVEAAKADPVAFAPILAKIQEPPVPTTSSTIPPLPNPTAPASSKKETKDSIPEPSQSCNIETFYPFY